VPSTSRSKTRSTFPPFFDPQASAAENYGAVGQVIGRKISHTFDTLGSAFDSTGRVRN
jgi:putative endopeptidase